MGISTTSSHLTCATDHLRLHWCDPRWKEAPNPITVAADRGRHEARGGVAVAEMTNLKAKPLKDLKRYAKMDI